MNSDFNRSISRRCVMSSSSITAPTRRSSASRMGVVRCRKARSAPSTTSGMVALLSSLATVLCDSSTSSTAMESRGSVVTSWIFLPSTAASGPNSGSAARLMRWTRPSPSVTMTGSYKESTAASAVCCATRILPRSDCRSCRIRSAISLNRVGEHSELVSGVNVDNGVEVAGSHAASGVGELPNRPEDTVRQEDRKPDPADDERRGRSERRHEPAAGENRGFGSLPPHRVLIEAQQPVALPAQLGEEGLELPEVLFDRRCRQALAAGTIGFDVIKEAIEQLVIGVTVTADRVDDLGFAELGDVGSRPLIRGIESHRGVRAAAELPGPSGPAARTIPPNPGARDSPSCPGQPRRSCSSRR